MATRPPQFRSAISRFYYAMYHAARACVFLENQGDDFQEHTVLPSHLPAQLDSAIDWSLKLNEARLLRNRADYESYPKSIYAWRQHAEEIRVDTSALLRASKLFLQKLGCTL